VGCINQEQKFWMLSYCDAFVHFGFIDGGREGERLVGRESHKTWGVRQPVDLRVSVIFWF
jgi:hypothetical protein